jgi:L-lysine exporter family protein LysE/ArgO
VLGQQALQQQLPGLAPLLRWGGAAFLAAYGVLALRRAWQGSGGLSATAQAPRSRRAVLLQALGFSLLNPHVYLDTVLLVGGLGAQQPAGLPQGAFVLGACLASLGWFLLIALGARQLAPWLARPAAWRVLDALIGVLMLSLAGLLLRA